MDYLNTVDYIVIITYFCFLVGLGVYLRKKASASLEDYCIGGRSLPWWMLGCSGVASWVDIAGTMIIVSFLYILGPRGLFIEFRGGVGLLLPFMLLWAGKWMRRSQCLTPAEWMIFRFGDGFGGRFAQLASAVGAIASTVGMLAYLVKAVGMFLSTFVPLDPFYCAFFLIIIATVYTMVSGFYGVVFTDIFQSGIILTAVIYIVIAASSKINGTADFAALATEVTHQPGWMRSSLDLHAIVPAGYEYYKDLFMLAMFYLLNNIFRGMGFPGDPKYFGARNDRECGTLSFMWTGLMTFRWPLCMGFAILGIFLVKQMFPDQSILADMALLIKQHFPDVTKPEWGSCISMIQNNSENYPELVASLQSLIGENSNWSDKLHLLSYEGTINPEKILPAVLMFSVAKGMRGLMLIALIAASMSTFDSTINTTVGIMTRDIYQKYIRPKASTKELIYMTWFFVVLIVSIGFLFAYTLKSVNDIWGWIVMGLGAGTLVPGFLRLYWWRFNGAGFAIGTFAGLIAAVLHRMFTPALVEKYEWAKCMENEIWFFCVLVTIGFIGSVIGTYVSGPTRKDVLDNFYKKTRPFGVWGPLKQILSDDVRRKMETEHRNDILALPFTMLWQVTLFLMPLQMLIRSWNAFYVTLPLFCIGLTGMYIFWYSKLPPANEAEITE
ncbi:MAG: sodium:solute symporter [Bacteroidetes bacterium]|nr:sodium:solute symporter [Bacteroidota bacterium]